MFSYWWKFHFKFHGDWSKLGTLGLAQMSLIKCYWMLQNARVTDFTIPELLREKQHEGAKIIYPVCIPPTWGLKAQSQTQFLATESFLRSQDIQIFALTFLSYTKTAWSERYGYFQNLCLDNLVNRQLQYTCCQISQETNAFRWSSKIRQKSDISSVNEWQQFIQQVTTTDNESAATNEKRIIPS